ncbi:replication initiator, partial [Nonomuraea wenchangensis]
MGEPGLAPAPARQDDVAAAHPGVRAAARAGVGDLVVPDEVQRLDPVGLPEGAHLRRLRVEVLLHRLAHLGPVAALGERQLRHHRAAAGVLHDPRLGEPLCPDCYDYTGSVLFNALAPLLWKR